MFAFLSAPVDTATPHLCSLDGDELCGLTRTGATGIDQIAATADNPYGTGIYNAEGFAKLCEGLKGSAVTSLECAAPPSVRLSVSAH